MKKERNEYLELEKFDGVEDESNEDIIYERASYTRPISLKSPQMYGDDVKSVQIKLNQLDYSAGTADGYFGPNTDRAVKRFQTVNGLAVDGSVGPATWNKLFSPTAKPNTSTGTSSGYTRPLSLKSPQMYGDDIKKVQNKLNVLKYNVGTANGYFGPYTEAGVKVFQKVNGLAVDGSVGPATWNKLFSSTAKPNTSNTIVLGKPDVSIYANNNSYNKMYLKVYIEPPQYNSKYCMEVRDYYAISTDRYFKNDYWKTGLTKELYEAIETSNRSWDSCVTAIANLNVSQLLINKTLESFFEEAAKKHFSDITKEVARDMLKAASKAFGLLSLFESATKAAPFVTYAYNVVKCNAVINKIF